MNRLITLKKDYNMKLQSTITKYRTPKYIYLPCDLEEIKKEKVKKEEKIKDHIISPISGSIVGTKYCMLENGKMTKCLTIQNDYKEAWKTKKVSCKKIANISFSNMLDALKNYDSNKLAEKLEKAMDFSFLLLNAMIDEPYVENEAFLLKTYTLEILEMLDILREKMGAKTTRILLKTSDRETIEELESRLGTFPNINLYLCPDYYLLEKEDFMKSYLGITTDCLILKPSEVKTIYHILKHNRYDLTHVFTISGDGILNPQVIETKIGTSILSILNQFIKFKKEKDLVIYINGLMSGHIIDIRSLITTKDLHSILIMKKDHLEEKECINCGKCVSVCPVGCNPKKVYDTNLKKYKENCIDCGLCSYICPSFINLRKYLRGDHHEK